ncbi:hypothetical protein DUNSADRAFT_14747 [Dunaliella salina]|uniref:Encoded protein n=1 Tax=Dunaliella salina TaxID=3046 RepID=A0ABQ7G6T0_DUNSA|nr:hypothetical protein DUNSADRAFT_14747 [Dunaliella salina]|eukprot:KAF5830316.1 hypothetical protein DUNSADRAFT_14747 [Dunaliella salina]
MQETGNLRPQLTPSIKYNGVHEYALQVRLKQPRTSKSCKDFQAKAAARTFRPWQSISPALNMHCTASLGDLRVNCIA